ncbi:MAG: TolC family protein [Planctomycetota bacterium]
MMKLRTFSWKVLCYGLCASLCLSGCATKQQFINPSKPRNDAGNEEATASDGGAETEEALAPKVLPLAQLPTLRTSVEAASGTTARPIANSEANFERALPIVASPIEVPAPSGGVLESAPITLEIEAEPTASANEITGPDTIAIASDSLPLNLPSVLATINRGHPIVGFARWRVQEAYAELDRAKAMWLPSIQSGFSFHRHDGNYQASNGQIVDVNRNSFQYGLGVGAAGAGTTPQPGLVAQFHAADAIFLPKVTQKTAWARSHAADATMNRQLRDAAVAYFELLGATQDSRIIVESQSRLAKLTKITVDFAEAGEGLQSDADRMRTELALLESRAIGAQEAIDLASVRLAQALSLDAGQQLAPMDVSAVPMEFVSAGGDRGALVAMALSQRPELKESQALVAAACEAYKREKFAPFVPSVLLGLSTGGFGGGLGSTLSNVDNRYDLDAALSWQVRNLGWGEKAARRQRTAQVEQAKFEKLRVMDQVAAEVSTASAQVQRRKQRLEVTEKAITTAQDSFKRNLERIQDGQGLPLEVLQSVQALETAQRAYNNAVISYNQAQMQLQWALGWQVSDQVAFR